MPRMTGKQALVEMLRAEGVKYVFGNPGTTELPSWTPSRMPRTSST